MSEWTGRVDILADDMRQRFRVIDERLSGFAAWARPAVAARPASFENTVPEPVVMGTTGFMHKPNPLIEEALR